MATVELTSLMSAGGELGYGCDVPEHVHEK